MRTDRGWFEVRVRKTLRRLPGHFRERLENVAIVVRDWPTSEQLRSVEIGNPIDLLGLYEGVPLTQRSRDDAWGTPDTITLFRRPILAVCASEAEVEEQIRETVLHEVAHYFGISDEQLTLLEEGKSER